MKVKEKDPLWLHVVRVIVVIVAGLATGGLWALLVMIFNMIFGTEGNTLTAFYFGCGFGILFVCINLIWQALTSE